MRRRRGFNMWGCLLYVGLAVVIGAGLGSAVWFKPWAADPPATGWPVPSRPGTDAGAVVAPPGAGWSYRIPHGWVRAGPEPTAPLYLTAVAPPLKNKPGGRSSTAYVAVLMLSSSSSTNPDTRPQAGFYEAARGGDVSRLGAGWSLSAVDTGAGSALQVDYDPPSGREAGTRYVFVTRADRVVYLECQWVLVEDRAQTLAGCMDVSTSLAISG